MRHKQHVFQSQLEINKVAHKLFADTRTVRATSLNSRAPSQVDVLGIASVIRSAVRHLRWLPDLRRGVVRLRLRLALGLDQFCWAVVVALCIIKLIKIGQVITVLNIVRFGVVTTLAFTDYGHSLIILRFCFFTLD